MEPAQPSAEPLRARARTYLRVAIGTCASTRTSRPTWHRSCDVSPPDQPDASANATSLIAINATPHQPIHTRSPSLTKEENRHEEPEALRRPGPPGHAHPERPPPARHHPHR